MDENQNRRPRNLLLLIAVVLAWLGLDRLTKQAVNTGHNVGDVLIENLLGFRIELVHNTGAAWGTFSGATDTISIVSLVVIGLIVVYSVWQSKYGSTFEMVGLALLGAGGIGNLIDRITQGYVTDFIAPTFISFPTFNVADIGVTCGVIIIIISIIAQVFFVRQAQDVLEGIETKNAKRSKKAARVEAGKAAQRSGKAGQGGHAAQRVGKAGQGGQAKRGQHENKGQK